MDTNKNWVDWKRFDAYSQFEFIMETTLSGSTYTFQHYGCYIFIHTGNALTIGGSAPRTNLLYNYPAQQSSSVRYGSLIICNASEGDNITASWSGSATYNTGWAIYYLGTRVTNWNLIDYKVAYNGTATISISDISDHVIIGRASGDTYNLQVNSTTQQKHLGTNCACASTLDDTGSASITTSGNSGSYSLVADIAFI